MISTRLGDRLEGVAEVTAGKTGSEARRARRARKTEWTRPELARLLVGEAQGNPGDSHVDGPSTFS
jgi:hypothetical protein